MNKELWGPEEQSNAPACGSWEDWRRQKDKDWGRKRTGCLDGGNSICKGTGV